MRLYQWDKSINLNDSVMQHAGCLFRSLQAVAEEYMGIDLLADEINQARKDLIQNKSIREDMYILKIEPVIEDALNRLIKRQGYNRHVTVKIDWNNSNTEARYSIVEGRTLQNNTTHFKLGDKFGYVIWNPAPETQTHNDKIVYMINFQEDQL
jgi:hypothetical protein